MSEIIKIENLSKSYGDLKAVDNLSMQVRKGELFAFLGPNGSGKSTTIDILCTYLKPDSGNVEINGYILGKDNDKIRQSIGVIHQKSLLDKILTVEENLKIRGGASGLSGKLLKERIERAVEITGISDFYKRAYGKLSGGQRRKVDIARGILTSPKILFLDEPTTGLDPQSRNSMWKLIRNLQKEQDMTLFLTTHYLEEAADADYVVVINKGKVVADGTPSDIREKHSKHAIVIETNNKDGVKHYLSDRGFIFKEENQAIRVNLKDTKEAIGIVKELESDIEAFEVIKGNLDDAFLSIIGKEIAQG